MKCILCISKNTTFYREFREYKHFRIKYSILIQLSVFDTLNESSLLPSSLPSSLPLYSFQFQVSFFLLHQITQFPLNMYNQQGDHTAEWEVTVIIIIINFVYTRICPVNMHFDTLIKCLTHIWRVFIISFKDATGEKRN